MYAITVTVSGNRSRSSAASSASRPHFSPTPPPPRNAKILPPTLATRSSSHGVSGTAPGLARQYATRSACCTPPPPERDEQQQREPDVGVAEELLAERPALACVREVQLVRRDDEHRRGRERHRQPYER